MKHIYFLYNPTSWRKSGWPRGIPRGMADSLVQPIVEHLPQGSWSIDERPAKGGDAVNVYFAHQTAAQPNSTSVFISHGIADKAWRDAPRLRRYTWVVVSGPAWTRKLVQQGLPLSKILELGYTKLDPLFQGKVEALPRAAGKLRVVWAPTHGGVAATSSWAAAQKLASEFPDDIDLALAPHPRHREDKRTTLEEYVGADVVIADSGSTLYEAWALGLPVVFPDFLVKAGVISRSNRQSPSFERQIYEEGLGYHAASFEELVALCRTAAKQGQGRGVKQFIDGILPPRLRGVSGKVTAEALLDIAAGKEPRHKAQRTPEVDEAERMRGRDIVPKVGHVRPAFTTSIYAGVDQGPGTGFIQQRERVGR